MKRAQVSLEFLVVSLVMVSLIGLWMAQVNVFTEEVRKKSCKDAAETSFSLLTETIESVYLMGEGNSQEIELFFLSKTRLEEKDQELLISSSCFNSSSKVFPEIYLEKRTFHGRQKVRVVREGDEVILESY